MSIHTSEPHAAVPVRLPRRLDAVAEFCMLADLRRRADDRLRDLFEELSADCDDPALKEVARHYLAQLFDAHAFALPQSGLRGQGVPGGGFLFRGGPDVA